MKEVTGPFGPLVRGNAAECRIVSMDTHCMSTTGWIWRMFEQSNARFGRVRREIVNELEELVDGDGLTGLLDGDWGFCMLLPHLRGVSEGKPRTGVRRIDQLTPES